VLYFELHNAEVRKVNFGL